MRSLTLALFLAIGCGESAPPPAPPAAEYTPSIEAPSNVAAPPADAIKTESGLRYVVLKPGDGGEKPNANSSVEVHYTGWKTDGERFDSSRERSKPARFPLKGVIAGWTEGLQLMSKGEHVRFWIPEELAYKGAPGKPSGMLVFDVELLSFTSPPPPKPPVPAPAAPSDVAAPPADAQKTKSGLAYKVIKKGPGGEKPTPASMVGVHYAGWTTDGKSFDFSRKRGKPAAFGVGGVIPGWTEGLQLMETGDHYRFWIPEELAYKGQPRRPAGMLVFDVELLEVASPPDMKVAADAKKTTSGLSWKLLSAPAKTKKMVGEKTRFKANWQGWSSEGGFDSNLAQEPQPMGGRVRMLPGLAEATQLLSEGEKGRFWIPEELAFKGRPGAPKGTIVYDIEITEITNP